MIRSFMVLTVKQEMFCREYLIDLNATQAAIRAEYSETPPGRLVARVSQSQALKIELPNSKLIAMVAYTLTPLATLA